jgi:RND family efflux transporter MFP subunit
MNANSPRRILAVFLLCAGVAAPSRAGEEGVRGITEPVGHATLSARVPGVIRVIRVREGGRVAAGDVILELDREQEELEVARRKLVWESRAELDSAAERVATFKMDLDATRRLFEQSQSVSRDEMEKKELEYKLAVAEHERLKVAEERERIEYEMAVEQLARRSLVSPLGGVVTKVHLEVGESCEPNTPLADVADASRFHFLAGVDAATGRGLAPGDAVRFVAEGEEGPGVAGEILFVSPVLDPASGLQAIKAVFDNTDGGIRPGTSGRMVLPGGGDAR